MNELFFFRFEDFFWLLFIFPGSTFITFGVLYLVHFFRKDSPFLSLGDIKNFAYLWLIRPVASIAVGVLFYVILSYVDFPYILFLGNNLVVLSIALYVVFEISLYLFHKFTHKSKNLEWLHNKHHKIQRLHWINSAEESWGFEVTVVLLYVFWLYIFQAPPVVYASVIVFWKVLLALTHYSGSFSYGILDLVFVSPKYHKLHHNKEGTANSITMSLSDRVSSLFKK